MNTLSQLLIWAQANFALVVAVTGVLLAWFQYRGTKLSQRKSVLAALRRELGAYEDWAHWQWIEGETQPDSRARDYRRRMLHKIVTVATDSAIQNGPTLFLNRELLEDVIDYRLAVAHLNQAIDEADLFQAQAELFGPTPPPGTEERMLQLLGYVFYEGIGDAKERKGLHFHYKQLDEELAREEKLRLRKALWYLLGLRGFSLAKSPSRTGR